MKKLFYWILGLILIVLIVVGILIWNIQQPAPESQIVQQCFNRDGYCVYNTPLYLKYASPGELNKGFIFKEDLSEYFVRDDSPKRLSEVFSGDWDSYKCVSTRKPPLIVEYFYNFIEGEIIVGFWHERRAVICENIYFVQDFTSTFGPRLYGPFFIEN